jgi:hypothetical protein
MISVFNDEAESDSPNKHEMNFKQKLVVITIDVLLIIELCIAMYHANLSPDNFTPTFIKVFFSLFLPTIGTGIIILRKFKSNSPTQPA